MSDNQTLVALSKEMIAPHLGKALMEHTQVLGFAITPYANEQAKTTRPMPQYSHYHSFRWSMPVPVLPDARMALREIAGRYKADLVFLPAGFKPQDIKVLAMDMDSTLINIECIDEIADFIGKKAAISEITAATMRGEIADFKESLLRRVALLEGISEDILQSVYQERLQLNPGAQELLMGAHALGLHTLLVSGGFTFFTDRLKERLGFKQAQANVLEIINSKLTGKVLGSIVDGTAKAAILNQVCIATDCKKRNAVTIGDGSNDLLMMHESGISIAYKAKPIVKEKADAAFDHVGLDATLMLL
jgi:phosphoserine phosphatase